MFAAVSLPDSITSGYSVPCTKNRGPSPCAAPSSEPPPSEPEPPAPRSRATSSKIRMNSSPMILRLRSGSVTPANAAKYRSAAFTWTRSTLNWRRNVSSTWSASPARISPVSTNTHVSCEPTALCTNAAATAESTPPDNAHSTRSAPTCARTASTCCSMIETCVHPGAHPHTSIRKWSNTSPPRSVCTTSGWNCSPNRRRSASCMAATGAPPDDAVATNPGGTSVMASPWLIQTDDVAGQSGNSGDFPPDADNDNAVRPYSPAPVRDTVPPSCSAMSCAP